MTERRHTPAPRTRRLDTDPEGNILPPGQLGTQGTAPCGMGDHAPRRQSSNPGAPPMRAAISRGLSWREFTTGMVGRVGRCSKVGGSVELRKSVNGMVDQFQPFVAASKLSNCLGRRSESSMSPAVSLSVQYLPVRRVGG